MGMYDTIKIDPNLLPIRKALRAGIDWNTVEWQTKSLDCELQQYELIGDGIISPSNDMDNFTGTINFYSDDIGFWIEFDAEYYNGRLKGIKRVQ